MVVRVLLFGMLKEMYGGAHSLTLPDNGTVSDIFTHFGRQSPQAALLQSCAVGVNQQYARRDHVLHDGDEVALLPPVSGGSPARITLARETIIPAELLRDFASGSDGAIVTFAGIVRDNTRGRRTLHLDYEAYEAMALKQMHELAAQSRREHEIRDALLIHRLGRLHVGEISVFIAVAAPHRAQAFAACCWLIDTLKRTVPIWKKEHFADGAVWADGEPFPEVLSR